MDVALLAKLVERYKPAVMSSLGTMTFRLRQLDPSRLDEEIRTYLEIYNRGLEGTWGFTPLQEREVKQIQRPAPHHRPGTCRVRDVPRKDGRCRPRAPRLQPIIRKLNGRLLRLASCD